MANSFAEAAAPSPSTVRKVALAASAIACYDFFIYLTEAALVFGKERSCTKPYSTRRLAG